MSETKRDTAKASEGKMYTEAELKKAIAEATKAALAEYAAGQQPQTVISVKPEEYVSLLFMGVMAEDSVFQVGKLCQISSPCAEVTIPKKTFLENKDYKVDRLLKKRVLIITNGLDETERVRLGVNYTKDELLSADAYYKLFEYDADKICEIFEHVCDEHKRVIASMFLTEYEKGSNMIHYETVKRLNALSKKIDAEGMFTPILDDMGKKLKE